MIPRAPLRVISLSPSLGAQLYTSRNSFLLNSPILTQYTRHYSTPITPTSGSPRPTDLRSQFSSHPIPQHNVQQPKPKRNIRRYIYATIFFGIGLTLGQYMRWIIVPPPFPLPGTEEDKFIVDYIRQDAEKIPLVKALSQDPSWKFYDPYDVISASHAPHMLTLGTLSGARGIGAFQRVFYNESGECITVIWFGGAIAGWPGVTHGGLSATVMDEALGRCAMAQFPGKSVVTAKLDLNYMKPAVTNAFYIIRVKPNQEGSTENKQWMHGRMETLDGKVCLEAKALFVVPKRFKTKSLTEG